MKYLSLTLKESFPFPWALGLLIILSSAMTSAAESNSSSADCGWYSRQMRSQSHRPPSYIYFYDVFPQEYPSMAILGNSVNRTLCPLSIISKRYGIIAASCIPPGYNVSDYFIITGLVDTSKDNDTGYTKQYKVEDIKIYPTFNRTTLQDDIALVKVSEDIEYNAAVNPICVPFTYQADKESDYFWIIGWERKEGSKNPFQGIPVSTYTSEDCRNYLRNRFSPERVPTIYDSQICTAPFTCKPCRYFPEGFLIASDSISQKQYLFGVYSWRADTVYDPILVFTKVSLYSDWINAETNIKDHL